MKQKHLLLITISLAVLFSGVVLFQLNVSSNTSSDNASIDRSDNHTTQILNQNITEFMPVNSNTICNFDDTGKQSSLSEKCLEYDILNLQQNSNPHTPNAYQIIAFYGIGNNATPDEIRHTSNPLITHGWERFIEGKIVPMADWGVKRFNIHNPYGRTSHDIAMEFDQLIHAKENENTSTLYRDFVPAWSKFMITYPDVEVIFYLGSMKLDSDFTNLLNNRTAFIQRSEESISQIIQLPRTSIAFDSFNGNGETEDSLYYEVYLGIKDRVDKTYIEPRPRLSAPHLWSENLWVTDYYFNRVTNPEVNYDTTTLFPRNDQLTGERIKLISIIDGDWKSRAEWYPAKIREIISDGNSSAVVQNIELLVQQYSDMDSFLNDMENTSAELK